MADFDGINAPQYFDFGSHNEQDADYILGNDTDDEVCMSDSVNDPLKDGTDYQHEEKIQYNGVLGLRKSMSVGDICYLEKAMKNNCLREVDESVTTSSNTSGDITKESLNKQYKYKLTFQNRQYGSARNLTSSYIPMAEAIKKFHATTPDRFHSKAKTDNVIITSTSKLATTVPHSPHFVSNKRHRPVNSLTYQEKELQEFQEAQKHKFKAHPVDKKILLRPSKLPTNIEKKPSTIPEPFNLAQIKPKVAPSPPKKEHFQAKPFPNFSKPQLKKPLQKFTKAETPPFLKRYQKNVEKPPVQREPKKALPPKTKTGPMPFSFEVRNELLSKKRETFIKKFIEDEKKAREFYAKPIPKGVLEPPKIGNGHSTKTVELRAKIVELKTKSTSEENLRKDVRPKSSIEVKKKPLTEIQEFTLSTDLRAKERRAFEQELKTKQEQLEHFKRINEEKRLQEEKEEIQRLRKMAEIKAQPVRKYKEVVIAPSDKVTEPISPKFHKSTQLTHHSIQLEDNKENSSA